MPLGIGTLVGDGRSMGDGKPFGHGTSMPPGTLMLGKSAPIDVVLKKRMCPIQIFTIESLLIMVLNTEERPISSTFKQYLSQYLEPGFLPPYQAYVCAFGISFMTNSYSSETSDLTSLYTRSRNPLNRILPPMSKILLYK